jgi:tetratricopeptide (TPR) repeat protein
MYKEALADYDKALSIDSRDTWTYSHRAQIHLLLENYEKAISDYGEIINLMPEDWGAYYNRALVYQQLNKKDLAAADFKKANELKAAKQK